MNLLVKRLSPTAMLPARGSEHAIGYDCFANLPEPAYHPQRGLIIGQGRRMLIPLGISVAIPEGCYGRLAPRSGLAAKQGVDVLAGVIDRDYRGEVFVLLINTSPESTARIIHGMRVCQLILEQARIVPVLEVESLDATVRDSGGFGSTGI